MAIKPDGKMCIIREQIIEDLVTELTFQFGSADDGTTRLKIFGDILPYGNRTIVFDEEGEETASESALTAPCPSWLKEVTA